MKNFLLCLFFGSLLLSNSAKSVATVIDVPATGGNFQRFGEGDSGNGELSSAAFGQTFRLGAGDGRYLKAISFGLVDYTFDTANVEFTFHIYEWNGSAITGDEIFGSNVLSTDDTGETNLFEIDLNYSRIDLDKDYMWLLNAVHDGVEGSGGVNDSYGGNYDNGSFYILGNDGDLNVLFTEDWTEVCPTGCRDLAFTLKTENASPVPVPTAAWLFGSGLLGLIGVAKRKNAA